MIDPADAPLADLDAQIAAAVGRRDFGRPTAARRGRNPDFPWVPIVAFQKPRIGVNRSRTTQVMGRAFADRDAAVACADKAIEALKARFAADLAEPRMRALRVQHGLPEEIPPPAAAAPGMS